MMIRVSSNSLVKMMLKAVIMLTLGGAFYAMYFSSLNERVSEVTRDPTSPSVTTKELINRVKGKTDLVKETIEKATVGRLKGTIEKTKGRTIGEVYWTVDKANEANQQLQRHLEEIEPAQPAVPQATTGATTKRPVSSRRPGR